MQILVTGSKGQLGNEFRKISGSETEHTWYFTDLPELDITKHEEVVAYFQAHSIDLCINCAAYTAVDKAEEETELANEINANALGHLADACLKNNALLIHVSTDYVFNGENHKPYDEHDPVNPTSAYGHSKAKGEAILQQHKCSSVIVRTAWLYSAIGHNFVKTMMRLGAERDELKVVADQVGSPTWAADLADALWQIAVKYEQPQKEIYHYSNEGAISWYDFAKTIMELNQLKCNVLPIESKDYPVKTKRPFYSVLNKSKIKHNYGITVPYWKESLIKCIEEINNLKNAE